MKRNEMTKGTLRERVTIICCSCSCFHLSSLPNHRASHLEPKLSVDLTCSACAASSISCCCCCPPPLPLTPSLLPSSSSSAPLLPPPPPLPILTPLGLSLSCRCAPPLNPKPGASDACMRCIRVDLSRSNVEESSWRRSERVRAWREGRRDGWIRN